MLYSIVGTDVENSLPLRATVRHLHVERLQKLTDQGRLILAGPNPAVDSNEPAEAGFTGSIIIAEFENLATAQHWADTDPYIDAGVYSHVEVKPFKRVLP